MHVDQNDEHRWLDAREGVPSRAARARHADPRCLPWEPAVGRGRRRAASPHPRAGDRLVRHRDHGSRRGGSGSGSARPVGRAVRVAPLRGAAASRRRGARPNAHVRSGVSHRGEARVGAAVPRRGHAGESVLLARRMGELGGGRTPVSTPSASAPRANSASMGRTRSGGESRRASWPKPPAPPPLGQSRLADRQPGGRPGPSGGGGRARRPVARPRRRRPRGSLRSAFSSKIEHRGREGAQRGDEQTHDQVGQRVAHERVGDARWRSPGSPPSTMNWSRNRTTITPNTCQPWSTDQLAAASERARSRPGRSITITGASTAQIVSTIRPGMISSRSPMHEREPGQDSRHEQRTDHRCG